MLAVGLLGVRRWCTLRVAPAPRAAVTVIDDAGRPSPSQQWTMPPLTLLEPAAWSTGRKAAMLALRGYLVVSVVLLIVKAVQLGGG